MRSEEELKEAYNYINNKDPEHWGSDHYQVAITLSYVMGEVELNDLADFKSLPDLPEDEKTYL